ncbi:DUF418 domain-containing protein [Flavilitoribacter nigricans]|uniref:DUF418 domain-containing protein n=1 Tax=Flavilitoribacter nigricans TaxID=70997 RepID=UPI0014764A40|nr:DUF418 domain-containing protein [Flavilitoribacter nigricans]
MNSQLQPTSSGERIGSLDFLRGLAILGILIINVETFSYPDPWSPYKFGFAGELDHDTRFWVYFLAQGKFFSMFTLLFGVGFYIFLERLEQKGLGLKAMDIYARRLLWLFVFGVVHAYLIWDGDILYHYATCGFLLFPFRSFSVRRLLLVLLIPVAIVLYNAYESAGRAQEQYRAFTDATAVAETDRSEADRKAITSWENRTSKKEADRTEMPVPRQTYFESIATNAEHTRVHKGVIFYQGILFRTLIMMMLGILLYKLDVFRDYRNLPHYWLITATVLAIALVVNYLRYYQWTYAYFEPVRSVWRAWLFAFPKELLGLAYILLFNGIYQRWLQNLSFRPVSMAGKMALTNYILQSIICGFIFYGYGLGQYNQISRTELLPIVAAIWVAQLVLSWWWLRRFRQGPLERLWRRLTYGRS